MLPSLRRGAVPELGACLQHQTFILVAPGKTFMLFSLGWNNWAGKEVRANRQSHFTWLHASVVQVTSVRPFPFFLFSLLFFFNGREGKNGFISLSCKGGTQYWASLVAQMVKNLLTMQET